MAAFCDDVINNVGVSYYYLVNHPNDLFYAQVSSGWMLVTTNKFTNCSIAQTICHLKNERDELRTSVWC